MYTFNIDPNKTDKQFQKYGDFFTTMRGVFLALLLFCASFLAPYIGCNYQKLLKQYAYSRYLILFLVIYISINLVDPVNNLNENPWHTILKSFYVFVIFLLLNSINISSIVILLTLFALLIQTSRYYVYFKELNLNHNNDKINLDILYVIQIVLAFSIMLLLLVSFFTQQNFNKKMIFKLNTCKLN